MENEPSNLDNLDLLDLLSERHLQLRNIIMEEWNNQSAIDISNSEWFIMARIYNKHPTISYVTKQVDITRQATHKFIKKLEAKGLVVISNATHNKKEKCVRLTKLGEECYEKNVLLKRKLEEKITTHIGEEKMQFLKETLKSNWKI